MLVPVPAVPWSRALWCWGGHSKPRFFVLDSSSSPKVFEPIRRQLGGAHRVLVRFSSVCPCLFGMGRTQRNGDNYRKTLLINHSLTIGANAVRRGQTDSSRQLRRNMRSNWVL